MNSVTFFWDSLCHNALNALSHFFKPLQVLFIYIKVSGFVLSWNFFVCKVQACVFVSNCAYCAFSLTLFSACFLLYYFLKFSFRCLYSKVTVGGKELGVWGGEILINIFKKSTYSGGCPLLRCFVKGNPIRLSWCWELVFLLTLSCLLYFTLLCYNLLIWVCTKAKEAGK